MLSAEEVEKLYTFCRQHNIRYYDVQVEIVDHFANAIEDTLFNEPGRSFDSVLEEVYQSFGGYKGLQRVQEQKRKVVETRNRNLKLKLFLDYFKPPKIAFTLFLVLASKLLITQFNIRIVQIAIPVLIIGALVWHMKSIWSYQHKMYKRQEELLMLHNYASFFFQIVMSLMIPYLTGLIADGFSSAPGDLAANANTFIIVFPLYIISMNSYKDYLRKIHTEANSLYPELFKVKAA
jgi:hypothetical protein